MSQTLSQPAIVSAAAASPAPRTSSRLARWVPRVALILILGAYALFLYTHFAPAISTPDSNGYWAQASLIAKTGRSWFIPEAETQYIGMHWLIAPAGQYISRYPPGLPAMVAVVYALAGYKASVLVSPIFAVLTLLGLYLLARRVVSAWWAIAGVLLLLSLPIYTQHALASESHMAVTFCLVWGTYLLLRWSDASPSPAVSPSPTRLSSLLLALCAGLLLGMIPTIRYPDAVMGLGIAIFIVWQLFRPRTSPRPYLDYFAIILGAAIPIAILLIRNQLLLGAFWRTGYSLTNEQTGFSWYYFKTHFFPYIRTIQGEGLGLAFALGVAGIIWMCATRPWRPLGIMLLLQSLAMVCLYMAYYWAPQGGPGGGAGGNATMRFLLPIFPGFILAAVWMLSSATASAPRFARLAIPLAIVSIQLLWGGNTAWATATTLHYQQDLLARVTDALDKTSSPGDVIIAGGQIQQNLDFVRHWKLVDLSISRAGTFMGRLPMMAMGAGADTPSPMQREKMAQRQNRYEGMDNDQRDQAIADDILDWAAGHPIYFVGTIAEMQQATALLANKGKFQIVSRVPLPDQPIIATGGGPFGMGGPGGPGGGGGPGGMQPPGGPMGGPGPGMPPGGPDAFGGPGAGGPGQPGGFMQRLNNRAGAGAGRGRLGGGGMGGMFGGSLAGQHEAIIARWAPSPAGTPSTQTGRRN